MNQIERQTGIEINDPTDRLQQVIACKREKNVQLNFAINDYVILKLNYEQKTNELILTTDFKAVTGESRPTVAMKEAWMENELFIEKMEMNIAKENVNSIKRDIDILNNEIKLYELQAQMRMI